MLEHLWGQCLSYGHTYTRMNTSANSTEYISTYDSSAVTIRDNELGVQNAKTEDGQFFHRQPQ